MKIRFSRVAVTVGLVLLVGAPTLWVLTRPADSAGDVAAVEASLRSPTTLAQLPPATTTTQPQGPLATTMPLEAASAAEPEPITPKVSEPYVAPDLVVEPGPRPVRLVIDDIEINAPVDPYGVNSRTGQMAVPRNVTDVAWYEFGASPGEDGSAVLAAHVDLASQGPGVFFHLRELDPGALVTVTMDDGSTRRFEVVARETYDKDELPLDVIFGKDGPAVLTLITCGGGFNTNVGSYDSNVVVYAFPADPAPMPT